MRWFTKRSVKRIVQSFLLGYSVTIGFFYTHALVLYKLGLPLKTWMLWIACVLGLASSFGLFYWIARD